MQRLRFKYGPLRIEPGQNIIYLRPSQIPKPSVPGYITRFEPNLIRRDGSVPRVDVIHLHHAVWLVNFKPTFAAGEEKTIVQAPRGFGWRYTPNDSWMLNDMIHNLEPSLDEVYVVWDMDFVPDSSPAAATMKAVRTQWIDVAGIKAYPVFDALRSQGKKGKFTFPDDARGAQAAKRGPAQTWTVDRDTTIVQTAGHLHPGGLYTDLNIDRAGQRKTLFRSLAKYWEPAGAVSWDVAMTATPPNWRIQLRPGDKVSVHATYDTTRASWYESMGIMPVAVYDGTDVGGVDPFASSYPTAGQLTHGALPENRNHGGRPAGLPDARTLLDGGRPTGGNVDIEDFVYLRGGFQANGAARNPPVVKAGKSLTFRNLDPPMAIFHTITACKAPCNRSTGVAYPLADGKADFDSGELGTGPTGFTAASQRTTWKTPRNLKPGTYTYFCRIHPFMRGSFRVKT